MQYSHYLLLEVGISLSESGDAAAIDGIAQP